MCPSLDDAPPSPKIAVYSIDIECKEEQARNTSFRVLHGHGPEPGPLILVHPAFGDTVLEVRTSRQERASSGGAAGAVVERWYQRCEIA